MTNLPNDVNGAPIPVLSLRAGGAHAVPATAASARNGTAFDPATRVVSVYATADVFLRFGDGAVTATSSDHFFPAGIYYDFSAAAGAHLAVLRAGPLDGIVHISEKV